MHTEGRKKIRCRGRLVGWLTDCLIDWSVDWQTGGEFYLICAIIPAISFCSPWWKKRRLTDSQWIDKKSLGCEKPSGKRLQKTAENHILSWLNQLFWLGHGFNSYVKLPECKCSGTRRTSSLSTILATCPMSIMPWGKICTQKLPKPGGLVRFGKENAEAIGSPNSVLWIARVHPGAIQKTCDDPRWPQAQKIFQWGYWSYLLAGIPTPLKNMSSSVGMMKFPIYGNS